MADVRTIPDKYSFAFALSLAELRKYAGSYANQPIRLSYGTAPGDDLEGTFYWSNQSTDADDGGVNTVAVDGVTTGRWKRVFDSAANLEFTPPGSGAVATTVQAELRGLAVNVLRYIPLNLHAGIAAGTNTTDLTTYLQAAIDALAGATLLYAPPGAYKATNQLTVAYPVTIFGAGRGATTFNFTALGTSKAAFKATVNNVYFRDFKLTGPSSAAYVAEENGILFYGTSAANKEGGSVVNVEINNFGSYGVLAEHYNKVSVLDSYVHDVGYGGIFGLSADDMQVRGNTVSTITPGTSGNAYGISASQRASEAVPVRFVFDDNTVDSVVIWEAIDTHGGTDGTISKNTITNCKLGINVSPSDGSNLAPQRISITGNTINKGAGVTTPGRGIGSGGYNGATKAEGIVVTGNVINDMGTITDYTDGAVMFQFTQGLVFTGNSIVDSKGTALGLYDSNTGFVVSGNSIAVVQAGHANASGVVVNAASQSGVIVGNMIETVAGRYGIFMAAASADVSAFDNKIIATGGHYVGPPSGAILTGSATYDPGSLADGAGVTTTITMGGIALGDYVAASFSNDLQGITVTAWVTDTSTVSVRFQNESGGVLDLASGTLRVRVRKA